MGSVIGQILGFAVGVAISPIPVIAVILMLFSESAARNSVSFAVGWVLGLGVVGSLVLALGVTVSEGDESNVAGVVKLLIGLVFVALAVKQWKARPVDGEVPAMPGWMNSIDSFTAGKSLGFGFVMAAINPKNLGLTVAAAATISSADLATGNEILTLVVYVVIASVTIVVPVGAYLILGDRADAPLTTAKQWLIDNNNTVMSVLFVVLGSKLIGDALAVLL
jgi:Sap, sulfolipid-1-addressing protein